MQLTVFNVVTQQHLPHHHYGKNLVSPTFIFDPYSTQLRSVIFVDFL